MTKMFKGWLVLLVGIGMSGMTMAADKATAPKPVVLNAESASVSAIVEKIDYKTREVTLKGPDGNLVTMTAGSEAIRFNEIKKGDQVDVDYLESVAVVVQSPDKAMDSAAGTSSAIVRNAGKKPSGTMVTTSVVTATVVKVDAKTRKATLKGPQGNVFDIDVAPDVAHLENVKKGDMVMVKLTQTLALDIHKPTKK